VLVGGLDELALVAIFTRQRIVAGDGPVYILGDMSNGYCESPLS
jgi:hypothetical protein